MFSSHLFDDEKLQQIIKHVEVRESQVLPTCMFHKPRTHTTIY